MSKIGIAGLTLLAGLAIGLWFGFNPRAHRQAERDWQELGRSFAHVQTGVGLNVRARQPQQEQQAAKSTPPSQAPWTSLIDQLGAAVQSAWTALQRAWLNISASIRVSR